MEFPPRSLRSLWRPCLAGLALWTLLLASCAPFASSLLTPTPTEEAPTPTPEPPPPALWLDPGLPDPLRAAALEAGLPPAASAETATARIEAAGPDAPPGGRPVSTWIYALTAPFATLADGVSAQDLRLAWAGSPVPPLAGPFWVEESTLAVFTALWGPPASDAVRVAPAGFEADVLWPPSEPGFALLPFEHLEPRWKVLAVDGQSPVRNDFDPSAYPLAVTVTCSGSDCDSLAFPASNRDADKLTVLVMTGVTALVRGTAWKMEEEGLEYPGRDIGDWLRDADLTHISNEIPFAENCPPPDPWTASLTFCSDPRYIALLEYVGADIIELTGNHFQDWGSQATLATLEMYRQRGWPYFGGGADLAEACKPLTLEHNGNRLAFIGCNAPGPDFAWATEWQPGAAPCGDYTWMMAEIANLRSQGYLPIATFQYHEYYTPEPRPGQTLDFRLMADAGAVIVSGSQSHTAQAMEFHAGSFIMYGLGNLFFDQMYYQLGTTLTTYTRQELIARHVFYDNRHISTELLTAMLEDYARPRPMTADERGEFLDLLFQASGWTDPDEEAR